MTCAESLQTYSTGDQPPSSEPSGGVSTNGKLSNGIREAHTRVQIGAVTAKQVTDFVSSALREWGLPDLIGSARCAAGELLSWIIKQGGSSPLALTVTWDDDLLFLELGDRGGLVPNPYVTRAAAELAMCLLDPPALKWGANLDERGRRLWVSFRTEPTNTDKPDSFGDERSEP